MDGGKWNKFVIVTDIDSSCVQISGLKDNGKYFDPIRQEELGGILVPLLSV